MSTVQQLIAQAATLWQQPQQAEALLRQAAELAPNDLDVLIARYRFYFYRTQLHEAVQVAEECLDRLSQQLQLPTDWRQLAAPNGVDFSDLERPDLRCYLFSLKAWGYLKLRLGELDAGRVALDQVRCLDPHDRIGSGVLIGVLDAPPEGHEYED